jgi:two-component system, LytTR family, response regulator
MITCLIVDDEPLAVQLLEDYIGQADFLSLAHKCYNAMDALKFLKGQEVDLIFMDINMPKLTGMELSSLLPPGKKIIFTTAYSEYAVQSYEKNAVDYLLKPITFERFMKAVVKAEKLIAGERPASTVATSVDNSSFFIKSGKSLVKLAFEKIFFIEGMKDYVTFHTSGEKLIAYKRMKELEETLPANFLRIHNSYIVNVQYVNRFEDNHVFINNERIPVSEKYRDAFFEKINSRLL